MKLFAVLTCAVFLSGALATSALAAPGPCKKGPEYGKDESKNKKGPNKCDNDCDCDGARTCSPGGFCGGTARPAGVKPAPPPAPVPAPPPAAPQPPNYGTGDTVTCYIKDRSKPSAMPGWTVMWGDSVGRSKGCAQVMQSCQTMKNNWAGKDVCCTLQNGPDAKKVTGKKAGDACAM